MVSQLLSPDKHKLCFADPSATGVKVADRLLSITAAEKAPIVRLRNQSLMLDFSTLFPGPSFVNKMRLFFRLFPLSNSVLRRYSMLPIGVNTRGPTFQPSVLGPSS